MAYYCLVFPNTSGTQCEAEIHVSRTRPYLYCQSYFHLSNTDQFHSVLFILTDVVKIAYLHEWKVHIIITVNLKINTVSRHFRCCAEFKLACQAPTISLRSLNTNIQ